MHSGYMSKLLLAITLTVTEVLTGCQGLRNSSGAAQVSGDITKVNHIILMLQENRSFDN